MLKHFSYVLITLSISFFSGSSILGQTVVLSGNVFLNEEDNHSGIEIILNRIAPAPLEEVVLTTNSEGHFLSNQPQGLYDITYRKSGYFSVYLGQISCFTNVVLPNKTLSLRTSLIKIPQDFNLIQHAINDSYTGDTILLDPDVYFENINMRGKRITLASHFIFNHDVEMIENTILDGGGVESVVICDTGESNETKLVGLTIQNGAAKGEDYPNYFGGGIRCINSSPTLNSLIIKNNYARYGGGGIFLMSSISQISNIRIIGNSAGRDGGGIRATSSSLIIKNSIIAKNNAETGGGITCNFFNNVGTTEVINCTIVYNSVSTDSSNDFNGGAGIKATGSNLSVKNSIVAFNSGDYGISFYNQGLANYPLLSYSNFFENGIGNFYQCNPLNGVLATQNRNEDPVDSYFNIFTNPNFTHSEEDRFSLSVNSTSIDAGNNTLIDLFYDIDGYPRIQNDNGLELAYVNIGAVESISGLAPVFDSNDLTICKNDKLQISIIGDDNVFQWFNSKDADESLFESGNSIEIDTLTKSFQFWVANVSYAQPSKRIPVQITVLEPPEFELEIETISPILYKFFAETDNNIESYQWSISGKNLVSTETNPLFQITESGSYEICLNASNGICAVTNCKTFELVITSSNERFELEYDILPNPVLNDMMIVSNVENSFTVHLIDLTGRIISSQVLVKEGKIEMGNFNVGIYFLKIIDDLTKKAIVSRVIKID